MNQTYHRRPEESLTPPRPAAIFGRTLRSIAIVLLCALGLPAALPSALSAATVTQTIDGLLYTIDTTAKTASVKQADTSLTSASILSSVTYQNVAYPVTKVEDEGFMSSQIAEVYLPQSLTTIGEKAFYGCQKLTELTVPENITSIGINGFYNCRRLTKVNWNAIDCYNGKHAAWSLFSSVIETVEIGPAVKILPGYCFANQSKLVDVSFKSSSIESIGLNAFEGCTALANITLPKSLKEIRDCAFSRCSALQEITFPENLINIGDSSFEKCSNLKTVFYNSIAANSNSIFNQPFGYINEKGTPIEEVIIGSAVLEIPNSFFSSGSAVKESTLKRIKFGGSVSIIKAYAFQNNSQIEKLEFPTSLKEIEKYAFQNCSALYALNVPKNVFKLGERAFSGSRSLRAIKVESAILFSSVFQNCTDLEKVCLNCDELSNEVFAGCDKIHTIYSLTELPPLAESNTFSKYDGVTVYVPVGALEEYRKDPIWKNFTDIRESDFADLDKLLWGDDEPDPKPDPKPETVTVDGVVYSLNHDAKTAIATGMVGEVMDMTIHGSVDVEGEDYAVTAIKDEAFADSGIETLVIDEGVETVGKMAFRDCSKLTSVKFPASISAIGDNAFLNCESIAAVNIADVRKWAQIDFQSDFGSAACNPMGYAGTFTVGDSSEPLTQLVLDDIEYVSQYAFFGANNLKTIKITGNTKIGKYVFANLQGVEALCLEISEIGEGNFISSRIPKVYSLTATPPAAKDAFYYWGGGDYLYVPKGSVEAYRNAEVWKDFSEIVESDFTGLDEIFDPDYTPSQTEPIEDVWIGDYKYTLYPDTQTATVTGYNKEPVHVVIPEQINFSGLYYVVNKIANNTFWRGTMESVELPESILEVGTWAFYMCNNLSELTIGENMKLLGGGIIDDCKNFTTLNYNAISCDQVGNINPFGGANIYVLNIGDKVKRLPRTFFRSIPIENLVIPDCVEELSSGAFYECENLKSVTIGANVKEIPGTFITCPAIEKVTFNAVNCADCTATPFPTTVKEISFGDKVERIPAYLCNEWTEIGNVVLPQSLKEIGRYAFQNVQGITEVTIPENVTAVHDMAFMNCLNLRKLTYNAIDCPEIGEEMYVFNRSVTDLTIGEKVTRIPAWGFIEQPIEKVVIPDAVTEIRDYAFFNCQQLKDVTIGKGVQKIANYAFNKASNISKLQFNAIECEDMIEYADDKIYTVGFHPNVTEVSFGDQVRRIPGAILALNEALNQVEIPASVEEVGEYAFYNCTGLTNVIVNDLALWAQIDFGHPNSNPITYAHTFSLKNEEKPVAHLNLKDIPEINKGTFYNADNLKTVRITGCQSILINAFWNTDNITDVCLDVQELGNYVFGVTKPGMNVYSLAQTPPATGEGSFYIVDEALTLKDVNLYVPVGCKDLYVADPFWGQMNVMESEMTDLDSIFDPENHNVGVSTIFDTDEAVYFTLDGLRVDAEHLAPGTYIRIANGKSTKILVK